MDAKAKVVAWQWRLVGDGDHLWAPATDEQVARVANDPDWETRDLIPITDHEAALAELRAELHEKEISRLGAIDRLEGFRIEHATLLTGLEALAGKIKEQAEKLDAGGAYIISLSWLHEKIEELTTLASSATGEKNTEEGEGDAVSR